MKEWALGQARLEGHTAPAPEPMETDMRPASNPGSMSRTEYQSSHSLRPSQITGTPRLGLLQYTKVARAVTEEIPQHETEGFFPAADLHQIL